MAHLQRTLLETVSLQIHFLMKTLLWLKIVLFTSRAAEDKRANLNNYTAAFILKKEHFHNTTAGTKKKNNLYFFTKIVQ